MKTAIFNVAMVDAGYVGGTPTPTEVRARAESGPVVKAPVAIPWSASAMLAAIPMAFDETTEAGVYDAFADLMVGSTAIKTFGPVSFMIPAGPTTVTYRSPAGLTVTVG